MAIGISFRKASGELSSRSKWWGAPDLPAGSPYPVLPLDEEDDCEPLTFLCQIRCEDLAEVDNEGLLPHEGMLYFFAAVDYRKWKKYGLVIYGTSILLCIMV